MIKGVIFDLDGTLIDSMSVWNDVDRTFLKECGIDDPPSDVSERVRKMTVDESAEFFISEFGLDCTKEYVINRIEELVRIQYEEIIPLKPGAAELLDYLDEKAVPYGVATATYRRLAESVLKRLGIYERMKFLLTDSDFPAGKTSPDIYFGAAELLGFEPSEILVAEDSLHCVETASAAGFFTVGVYDEVSASDRDEIKKLASVYVNGLEEIIKLNDWK
ncbi:MAG: HAD family phosphatase [Ruminococcus sp.]|nr:HAD family phosphatase [Ruminococcus sp.]